VRDFQDFGSELVFLRERMVRGSGPPDAGLQELILLAGRPTGLPRSCPGPPSPCPDHPSCAGQAICDIKESHR
jgi:hypothetical protein